MPRIAEALRGTDDTEKRLSAVSGLSGSVIQASVARRPPGPMRDWAETLIKLG